MARDRRQGPRGAHGLGGARQGGAGRLRAEFERRNEGKLPADWKKAIAAARAEFIASGKEMATRAASGAVLDHLTAAIPEMLGGSADLTPSNNTKAKGMIEIKPGEYNGSYMHYGVREHGMAAAMNGIALHGGLIPYGGTFLCFSDYCRPSIRLAALMQIRTIFVMTHDFDRSRRGRPDASAGRASARRCARFRISRSIARATRSRPRNAGR